MSTGADVVLKGSKRAAISPFIVMDVMRAANKRAAGGGDVLHLEVGQPSTPAPAAVLAEAKAALDSDRLGYTDALGIPELRSRIAGHYKVFYGIEVDTRRIVVTTGSSGAFLLSFLSAFDQGDRVGLALPGYPAYKNILAALDIEVVEIPVDGSSGFQPSAAILEGLDVTLDGLIIASPSNPTGSMLDAGAFALLTEWCRKNGVRLISDEIYHGITYGPDPVTALSLDAEAIIVNSFSKYFSMTGWRLGWMILPEKLLRAAECLTQNFFISPPTLSQIAAAKVFDCYEELDANVARYGENRALLLDRLPGAGFEDLAPSDGAFYIYANVAHLTNDSQEFCKSMLAETGVAVTPGIDFDPERGHRYVRFSYAGSTGEMEEAAKRLKAWLK
ncbi:MAG: 1-aminocyclopropane-1-carboxylate deaminase [Rhodospirillaceae bacterium]|nr:1-aminocyclopropane-1-carboxylate deaminase [Rhodospirillaceae bacterium]